MSDPFRIHSADGWMQPIIDDRRHKTVSVDLQSLYLATCVK